MAKVKQHPAAEQPVSVFTRNYVLTGWQIAALQGALIALVTLWIYSPALFGDWLWDDALYLSHNRLLEQPDRLWKAWFQPGSFIEYYPLHQTLQWIQWQLWGDNTLPYHLTNVVLHIVNALLLWRLLARLGVKLAWIGGLIFAVHPMNVESVAWISEFKNTLALVPGLLAMSTWIDYEQNRRVRDYRLALALFVVSMLCKITMAMFPFVMLLYAWWKRGRVRSADLLAAAPFALISLVLGVLTPLTGAVYLHHIHESPAAILIGGPLPRLALAGTTISFYFAQIFLPLELLPIYPQWPANPPSPLQILPWLLLAVAIGWLWTKRRSWGRHALFGLGFFLINIVPFSGLVAISYMNFSWVMDHFLYLPAIGVIALITAALGDLDDRLAATSQLTSTALITLIIGLLAFRAHWYAAAFTNEETFWGYTIERNPGSWMAQSGMGKAVLADGDPARAIKYLAAAAAENPSLAEMHTDLGNALAQAGQVDAGVAEMQRALQLDPYDANANNNLGIVLARQGKAEEALAHFITSLRSKPDDPETYCNLGNTYFTTGKLDLAENWYERALQIEPRYPEARYNLGCVRLQQGRLGEATADFAEAIRLKPDYVEARNNLGTALTRLGQLSAAAEQFRIVLQIDPENATAQANLIKLQQGAAK